MPKVEIKYGKVYSFLIELQLEWCSSECSLIMIINNSGFSGSVGVYAHTIQNTRNKSMETINMIKRFSRVFPLKISTQNVVNIKFSTIQFIISNFENENILIISWNLFIWKYCSEIFHSKFPMKFCIEKF